MQLSSVDLYLLVQGWRSLVGARFDKAYQADRPGGVRELLLQLNKSGEGKLLLRILLPGLAYLATSKPEFPQNPPGFAMFLRKRLRNARLTGIRQLGSDRIFVLTFERRVTAEQGGDATKKAIETTAIIIELFAPGNVVVVGEKILKKGQAPTPGIILNLLRPEQFKDRTLRGGTPYTPPPPPPDLTGPQEALVAQVMAAGKDSLVKSLAIGLGIGGQYSELVCRRAGLDRLKERYTKADAEKAVRALHALLDEKPRPIVHDDVLFAFGGTVEKTLDEALDLALTEVPLATPVPKRTKSDKHRDILASQEAQRAVFLKTSEEQQRKGELIYEHYQELDALLSRWKHATPEERRELLKLPFVKSFDPQRQTITVEFP